MQKPTFPAQNVIVIYLKKERSHENNPCFLRASNCGEVDITYHVYMLTQLNFIIHFNNHWCLLPGTCQKYNEID